ncbi:MAG: lipopolysaccharide heptosyltransferase [gamma proteobacterium symbiont of Ctena orbiculata]|uniref:Glycosyltransferase family 9 protein n=1 Tax=Candidatus Thiodiazotropha taylori TaxID=2792791 RepID=A0A944M5G5_9GAMM|nr:glycosyltransferase family 9 protein [Candidatus Thiodiazotropha taylori]PUB84552.1 MAG: lipopolysaccharide heptosyltransferase [gamma proteobacterium symbiont of Ctena orbiculata]MBT2987550.1 glycosyltransferase family 9 protein [Candidatus Thiodiazotropha taylori]MBT2995194.1 glycosyltransferase family 9 protein [Candidatus Thiodiazotropha taylori]MBT2999887.1 glycosyltransferase family 9 protein [Candidatus Thiodiazotropha taylori]
MAESAEPPAKKIVKLPDLENPSILIVRLSAIGDIVFATPLVEAIRQRYPGARISWLVQEESKGLLEFHPGLDRVIVWPRELWERHWEARQWLRLWRVIRQFRDELRDFRFDIALDVQGLMKSGFLAWLSAAGIRIGLGSREGSQWLMTRVIDKGGEPGRIASEYLYFAQQLGLGTERFEMRIGLSDEDRTQAQALIAANGLKEGFIVIAPFTTRAQKHWFNRSWNELLAAIGAEWRLPVVILGGPGDRDSAAAIGDNGQARLVSLVGETSLRQAAAVIEQAKLIIGVDTGLTHMGIAMHRPTLCLFGSTRPYLDTTHENAAVIYHPRECSPCKRKPTCNGRFDCMREIKVAEVMSRASRLAALQREAG